MLLTGKILIFSLLFVSRLVSGVYIWMPDTTLLQQGLINYPVMATPKNETDSLIAYQVEFFYDTACMDFIGISVQGTMTEAWGAPLYYEIRPGVISAAGFTAQPDSIQLNDTSQALFYLLIESHCDSSQSSALLLENMRLFDKYGDLIGNASYQASVSIVVNYPPEVLSLPDRQILEDDSFTVDIGALISDRNDADENLMVSVSGGDHFIMTFNTSALSLFIRPEPNWYGESAIQIDVEDPFGDIAGGVIGFKILPQNDAPGPFILIHPEDNAEIGTSEVQFKWQESENFDPEDEIQYRFFLSPDSLFLAGNSFQIPNIKQPALGWQNPLSPGTYFWKVTAQDQLGLLVSCENIFSFTVPLQSSVASERPSEFALSQNIPNPFNPMTLIEFSLPEPSHAKLLLYNLHGQLLEVLLDQKMSEGNHQYHWDAAYLAAGAYFYRLVTDNHVKTRKCVLLK